MSHDQNVVMIGIDSADAVSVEGFLPQLPHLRGLAKGGGLRRLRSPAGVMSASVWPTFYTGTPPGEHGYYFPMQWEPESMRLRRASDDWLYREPFWYELSRKGLPVTAFDVQTAFPSRIARGVEITNWGAQSFCELHTNRPDLVKDLLARFGRHPMGPDVPARKTPRRLTAIRRDLLEGARRRGDVSLWLLRQTEWRLFITVFVEVHRAGHNLWPNGTSDGPLPCRGDLFDVYRAVDAEIGRILAELDLERTTVVVFSLHGMGANDAQMHFLPGLMDRLNATFLKTYLPGAPSSPTQRSLMRRLRERVPSEVQELVGRWTPDGIRDWVVSHAMGGGFDWSRTPGFALPTGGEGYIRCSLRGREGEGLLPAGGELHERYLEHLTRECRALRIVESGAALVRDVVFPSADFPGSHSRLLPDVSLRWSGEPPATEIHSAGLGTLRCEPDTGRGGNHRGGGFAIVAGARAGAIQAPADIMDFAALVPHLL